MSPTRTENFVIIPGDPESSVVIHVPHASTSIPLSLVASFELRGEQLAREATLMADLHTDLLARQAADSVEERGGKRPWLFINMTSRLVCDPERFPDESEEMNRVGMGAIYTHTSNQRRLRSENCSNTEKLALLNQYFHPYSEGFANLIEERLGSGSQVSIIDLHSYAVDPLPYELHADGARPNLCIGVDDFHTPSELVETVRQAFAGVGTIGVNTPFSGTYVPLKYYQSDSRVMSVMLELRKDTYEFSKPRSTTFTNIVLRVAGLVAELGR